MRHELFQSCTSRIQLGSPPDNGQIRRRSKIYSLTGPEALTFTEMAEKLSVAVGRTIMFVDVPPEFMRAALDGFGFPSWQADGVIEEFPIYRRGEATSVEPSLVAARSFVRGVRARLRVTFT